MENNYNNQQGQNHSQNQYGQNYQQNQHNQGNQNYQGNRQPQNYDNYPRNQYPAPRPSSGGPNDFNPDIDEKLISNKNGVPMLIFGLIIFILGLPLTILFGLGLLLMALGIWMMAGCKNVGPNEAAIFTLFGKYHGTIREPGYHWINPFASAEKDPAQLKMVSRSADGESVSTTYSGQKPNRLSTKVRTVNNELQKVNDFLGNPVIVGSVVSWRITNPTKAVYNVDNYATFLNSQSDSIVRNTVRLYPYENLEDDGVQDSEYTLIGSSQMIANQMQEELQDKADIAGIEIIDVKLSHISYADEISAAMLQRQQATAIVSAKGKIVQGAVGVVEDALAQLEEKQIVTLDDELRSNLVNNLLVVLTGSQETTPVVHMQKKGK